MHFDPFRNKWSALALVVLITLAAAALVGSEEEGGPLDFAAKRAASYEAPAQSPAAIRESGGRDEFVPPAEFSAPASEFPSGPMEDFGPEPESTDDADGYQGEPMVAEAEVPDGNMTLEAEVEASNLPTDGEGSGS